MRNRVSRQAEKRTLFASSFLCGMGSVACFLVGAEQQCDAPQARQTYQGVDDAGQQRGLAPKAESHRVKAKQADAAPVQRADDGQDQCDLVDHHEINLQSCPRAECGAIFSARREIYTENYLLLPQKNCKYD